MYYLPRCPTLFLTSYSICATYYSMTIDTKVHSPIPRKLNDSMIIALSEYVAKGNYANHACYLCGIDETTLCYWQRLGLQDIESGEDTIYSKLFLSLKKARAQAQAEMVSVARNSAVQKRDGYLAVTVLERTDPENWGRKDRIQAGGNTYNINIERALVDASGKLEAALGNLVERQELTEGE